MYRLCRTLLTDIIHQLPVPAQWYRSKRCALDKQCVFGTAISGTIAMLYQVILYDVSIVPFILDCP
jgi:hypothetical protein